ncbi:restriction endonuclease subunit S [Acinetobacter sp. VNK23]|uniref:restriction endonuclease subunit S n=1 Tax=Acinetobacter thutiue TaxID=2998078 RepID=UPI002574CE94|nr:restriction endonuclease subunit S [Acinetobacter thutiue]MDM1021760.1 restriction endonuclease subunit S [Acinetobacter thutiue]
MSVPKLRFKEFDGEWAGSKLGRLIGISSASRVFKEQWQESGVPFYRTSDVISIFKNKENEKAYISLELFEELAKKSGKIQKGDLLVTGGGTIGIPYLIPNNEPLYFKDADLLWLKSSGVIDGSFLYNFFISPKFREYLKSISHTGTISHFTIEQAKETPFKFPSKPEQTKIASFLCAVDEKISQLTQKHELLSQYKQGMMQKLFSQQIRFKADDGSEFGEWEEKTLGEVVNFSNGKRIPLSEGDRQQRQGEYRYYGASGVIDYIDEYIFDGQYILIGEDGANILTRSSPLAFVVEGQFWVNNHAHIFQSKHGNNVFLATYLESLNYEKFNSGTAQPKLNMDNLKKVPVINPCIEEQTKIANFLSAIDQKIEVVAQQIEHAKTWKKGLLQQMFV